MRGWAKASRFVCPSVSEAKRIFGIVERGFPSSREATELVHETLLDTFDRRLQHRGEALSAVEETAKAKAAGVEEAMGTKAVKRVAAAPRLWLVWRNEAGYLRYRVSVAAVPEFAKDLPEGSFRDQLLDVTEIRRLLPRAKLDLKSTVLRVEDARQKTVVRLSLEHGAIDTLKSQHRPKQLPATLWLQPLKGYGEEAQHLAKFLEEQGLSAVEESRLHWVVTALGESLPHTGNGKPLKFDPAEPAQVATQRALVPLLETVRQVQHGVLEDIDTEFLHDFRVAIRRTRVCLGQMRRVFAPSSVKHLRSELRWLGHTTNQLRDLDVHLLDLPELATMLPRRHRSKLAWLETTLKRRRRIELARVQSALRSERYEILLRDWAALLDPKQANRATPKVTAAAGQVVASRIKRLYQAVLDHGRAIDEYSQPESLHALRLRCKKLRYLLELFRGLFELDEVAKPLKRLKSLQNNLGQFNDLEVQQRMLARVANEISIQEEGGPGIREALDQLVEALESPKQDERQRFAKCFRRFDDPAAKRRLYGGLRRVKRASR